MVEDLHHRQEAHADPVEGAGLLLGRRGAADLALGPRPAAPRAAAAAPGPAGGASLEAVERQHLIQALEQAQWNVTRAARLLDISRDTLRYRIEKHGLQRPAGQFAPD